MNLHVESFIQISNLSSLTKAPLHVLDLNGSPLVEEL